MLRYGLCLMVLGITAHWTDDPASYIPGPAVRLLRLLCGIAECWCWFNRRASGCTHGRLKAGSPSKRLQPPGAAGTVAVVPVFYPGMQLRQLLPCLPFADQCVLRPDMTDGTACNLFDLAI